VKEHKFGNVSNSDMANAIRVLTIDAVEKAKSGHPGMPMGMADVATVLYSEFLNFDPLHPAWPDRDRFVLSAGHGSMLLYALLYLTGYSDMPIEEIKNFRQFGAKTAGHPEYGEVAGIETTTGPLGQGLANAVGMALAEKHLQAKFGSSLVDHYTYCIAGDGCLMEGLSHEAASLAGHHQLAKLVILFDDNGISIDGPTSLTVSDDHITRFEAYNWQTMTVDGHDPQSIRKALTEAKNSPKPTFIACKTTIGYGSPNKGGTASSHGAPLGEQEIELTRSALDWSYDPFVIPCNVLAAWRDFGARGATKYRDWVGRLQKENKSTQNSFNNSINGFIEDNIHPALEKYKKQLIAEPPQIATRVASQNTLEVITPILPELLGGSADLTGSNNTKTRYQEVLDGPNASGSYVHYGVREHAMAAAMNGMALHGGVIPYGGTFLVFTDYCRPSIRLAALMKLRVIFVMTHDSIGLGEDGPTHQPVEHLASLRAIPNLNVFRPADSVETAECWETALVEQGTPSIIALSRQNVPAVRLTNNPDNLCSRGGYVLRGTSHKKNIITIISTGSEVSIALDAQDKLEQDGLYTSVVSMPCCELFYKQEQDYKDSVIRPESYIIVVEAGVQQSWDRILGNGGKFIGMHDFGASAPAKELFEHYNITAEAIVEAAKTIGVSV